MAQKRRKDSLIVSFLLDKATLSQIDQRVEELALKSRGKAMSRSEWIKRAIQRDFDHDARSRRSKRASQVHGVAGGEEAADRGVPVVPAVGTGDGIDPALLASPSRVSSAAPSRAAAVPLPIDGGPSGDGLQSAVPV